ncbi:damage-inducible protein DinB [Lysinibacillus sp. FJAT-14745]|uniref:DinB family protein n=1 Tax=Lysinibacillus sp. FJAT-14745 TaxID=1704289 RepID=UPI0006ABDA26|nr:DinB family protein [Lysinibacillus sp. FJAT-14745]KOP70330.1 damage-inducible protein DinB [Lysinibacillus sp. FJAT-14745]
MYRQVDDFFNEWSASAQGTLQVLKAITDDKLEQSIVEGHSSLGWLGWHLVGAAGYFSYLAGLKVPMIRQESTAAEIVAAYENVASSVKEEAAKLSNEDLLEEVKGFTGPIARGAILRVMVDHQTHHRGQMTVLLRQAGLPVPGVLGPTKEMQ